MSPVAEMVFGCLLLALCYVFVAGGASRTPDADKGEVSNPPFGLNRIQRLPGGSMLQKGLMETPVDSEISAVVGGEAFLPCDIKSPPSTPVDRAYLILLSLGLKPVYSVDARSGKTIDEAKHWSNSDQDLPAKVRFTSRGTTTGFLLQELRKDSGGNYFCKVEFETSPTRHTKIRLSIIVPPKKVIIMEESGKVAQGVAGPMIIGSTLKLTCMTYGGTPPPSVSWWLEGRQIDTQSEAASANVITNHLVINNLNRDHLLNVVTCQANNTDIAPPVTKSVTIDMIFPPLTAAITQQSAVLKENQPVSLSCVTAGSRPAAKVTWWKDGFLLNDTNDVVFYDGNVTKSTVTFVPRYEDDSKIVTCRAENGILSPTSVVEDATKLTILYAPRVTLTPGQMMNMSRITEGDDVYLECHIHSRPDSNRVQWFHQELELFSNVSQGVILSHRSLVLQHVRKTFSGNYTCVAANTVGSGESEPLELSVKFIPSCFRDQQRIYGGGNEQLVNVTCRVEAYPPPVSFRWAFNTSADHVVIPYHLVKTSSYTSVVSYTPLTHLDFGSLLCWAKNEVGEQKTPCVFQVVPASPPEAPSNCTVWHEAGSGGEVVVACRPGWDGGLSQNFSLEVRRREDGQVLAALRDQPIAHFSVTGLSPGTEYLFVIVASNSQGSAPPIRVVHLTPIDIAEKRLSATVEMDKDIEGKQTTSMTGVLLGVLMGVLLCSVLIGLGIKYHCKRHLRDRRRPANYDSKENIIKKEEMVDTASLMQKTPDSTERMEAISDENKKSTEGKSMALQQIRSSERKMTPSEILHGSESFALQEPKSSGDRPSTLGPSSASCSRGHGLLACGHVPDSLTSRVRSGPEVGAGDSNR